MRQSRLLARCSGYLTKVEKYMNYRLFVVLMSLVMTAAANAHHSYAIFDRTKSLTISMTVTKLEWTNPHAWIHGAIIDEKGDAKAYSLELSSLAILQRKGIRSVDIKAGDKITAVVNPARDGTPIATVVTATFANGKKLTRGDGSLDGTAPPTD
jgi:Family of unknown function (DUF6152)